MNELNELFNSLFNGLSTQPKRRMCGNYEKTRIEKIIFNDPAVIVITSDGRKFVSKAHNEAFDEEKGLLMCIAKMCGVTHLNLKKMIKGAQKCGTKAKE